MVKVWVWVDALRLRTLPLALSSVALGGLLSGADQAFRWSVTLLAVVTTLFLQILSNLANDYGDSKHGVDNEGRLGPTRTVQSGQITSKSMKKAVIIFAGLSLISGIWLILDALAGHLHYGYVVFFFLLGIAAILAAIRYTAGKNPYGYKGLGDLFVFLFFGLAGVLGTYFLNTLHFSPEILLPASTLGLFSAGVLNINNMRDRENDQRSGKRTLAVFLGTKGSKMYHLSLIGGGILSAIVFTLIRYTNPIQLLWVISVPLFALHMVTIIKSNEPSILDKNLKKLAVYSLLFSILFGISFLI
jgi:1,4-dihydroxy-2-naphthoate polyprenyltransferase